LRSWRPIAHTSQTTFQTELGQLIDLITAPEDHVDLSKFSLEK
jgi:farnesyl diphosphate synthase